MRTSILGLVIVAGTLAALIEAQATPKIRNNGFFVEYPSLIGSRLDDVPSNGGHCGVCHFNFDGGGPRNPYGLAVQANYSGRNKNYQEAVQLAADYDSDGDGVTNSVEITDNAVLYDNTPTFPGLTAGNVGSVSSVTVSEIEDNLAPTSGGPDTTPPTVAVTSPNGGETVVGNTNTTSLSWMATDASGVAGVNIYLSLDNGGTYTPIALNLPNTGSFDWYAANRPTSNALVKVEAIDNAFNQTNDTSDAVFYIVPPTGGLTTLRDFDLPGSQPLVDSGLPQELPSNCASCHGGYSEEHEPYRNWMGSMMAQAALDPIFKANMSIANQDAPDSGDLCLRCHNSRGWLDGRSVPTDGHQMTPEDQAGVSCDLCHRLVDPVYQAGISPIEDDAILNSLENVPQHPGNGMYVFDPNDHRRGPFNDSVSPHTDLLSPFHTRSAICGTCHDVSNPVFVRDGTNAEYVANNFDEAPATDSPYELMPVERTYSEWFHSAYNSTGVFAPQFAGNRTDGMVSSCQDCHMPDILGQGCDPAQFPTVGVRTNLPLHDMTGGSSWLSRIMPAYAGLGEVEGAALTNGAIRAEYMLRKAARMQAEKVGDALKVVVINDTGHKLPTGYPEGRRVWINLRFYDAGDSLLAEHGGYDYSEGVLTNEDTVVYEIHPGIGTNLAAMIGVDPGPSLHFVLNNQIYEDNRIPPRGFTNSVFETFGGAPVGHHYDDGQYWDESYFEIPEGAVRAHAQLYYQSTSKEFIEFLYTNNVTDANGANLYNMWLANDKCPPVLMTEAWWPENFEIDAFGLASGNKLGIGFNSISGYTYWIEYSDELGPSNLTWKAFNSNGMVEAVGSGTVFTDDFTSATSGGEPAAGKRSYRIRR